MGDIGQRHDREPAFELTERMLDAGADVLEAVFGIPMLVIPHPDRPYPLVVANVSPEGA